MAGTNSKLAVDPSVTKLRTPESTQPSPSRSAVVEVVERSHPPASSVRATVAIVSPEAMPGRYADLAASSPTSSSAFAARATVEK